ncbi:MAG: hypothetical protein IJ525_03055 [Alphaproteobacteria bacterium]|nr:hypothetical protein [Alphaproteobacteria bacterium]
MSISKELVYGIKPIKRENPKAGESEWYYVDPRGAESLTEMETIDVPNEFSPNPYADEIQDYIYEHNKYDYHDLYGDAVPPKYNLTTNNAQSGDSNELGNHVDNNLANDNYEEMSFAITPEMIVKRDNMLQNMPHGNGLLGVLKAGLEGFKDTYNNGIKKNNSRCSICVGK